MTLGTEEKQTMQEQIQSRLQELQNELETGQAELQKVEMRRMHLRETLLRIEGAMYALGELLTEGGGPAHQNGGASAPRQEQPTAARADEADA